MDTHGNRALFSRAMVKVAACAMLTTGLPLAMYAEAGNIEAAMMAAQQTRTVSGQIVDSKGETIIGANVIEKGTSNGSITDFDGNFSLEVAPNATLVISYIGYKTIEIKASEVKAGQAIMLQENSELMDEVVVVGYGTQRKATLTGSISAVSGDELKNVSAANLTNALAGKTAGVIANTRSGEPGADDAEILIRGKGTLGNTAPLILSLYQY